MGGDLMHGFAGLEALMAQVGDGRLRPADSDDGAGGGRGIGKCSTGGRGGGRCALALACGWEAPRALRALTLRENMVTLRQRDDKKMVPQMLLRGLTMSTADCQCVHLGAAISSCHAFLLA